MGPAGPKGASNAEVELEAPRGVDLVAPGCGSAGPMCSSIAVGKTEAPRGVDLVAPGYGSAGPMCESIVVGKLEAPRGVCVAGSGDKGCAVVGAVRVLKRTGGVVSSGPGSQPEHGVV